MTTDQLKPSEQKPSERYAPDWPEGGFQITTFAQCYQALKNIMSVLDEHHAQLSDMAGVVRVQKEQIAGLERAVTVLMAPHANLNNPNVLFDHASVWCNQHLEMVPDDFGLPPPEPREEWPKWTKMFALGSGEQVIYRYDRDGTCSALHSSGIWGTCSATRDPKEVDVTHKEATQINPAIAKTHPLPIKLSDGRYAVITSASNYNAAGEAVPAKADPDPCPPHNWQRHPDASGNNDAHWTCRKCGARTDRRPGGKAEAADPDISGATGSGRVITPSPTGDEAGEWAEKWITSMVSCDNPHIMFGSQGFKVKHEEVVPTVRYARDRYAEQLTAYAAHRTREIQGKLKASDNERIAFQRRYEALGFRHFTCNGCGGSWSCEPTKAQFTRDHVQASVPCPFCALKKAESALEAAHKLRADENFTLRTERDAARGESSSARSALSAANRRVGELERKVLNHENGRVSCAWCEAILCKRGEGDDVQGIAMTTHAKVCPSHPTRAVEAERDAIKSASASKDAEIKRLSDMVERLRFLVPAGVRWDEPAKPTTSEGKGVEG